MVTEIEYSRASYIHDVSWIEMFTKGLGVHCRFNLREGSKIRRVDKALITMNGITSRLATIQRTDLQWVPESYRSVSRGSAGLSGRGSTSQPQVARRLIENDIHKWRLSRSSEKYPGKDCWRVEPVLGYNHEWLYFETIFLHRLVTFWSKGDHWTITSPDAL